ncbi:MAG: hypothetical protein WKI04_03680 [Ferruginibacter sp.]
MLPVFTQSFYARKWPLTLLLILLVLPFLILKLQGDRSSITNIFILIGFVFCLLGYFWAKYMSVTIDNEGITYQVIFRKIFIPWKHVRATKLSFEFHGKSGDFVWNFVSIHKKEINFSTGYFSKSVIRQIAEAVVEKCPEHITRGKIKEISQGKFPWYIF